MPVVSMLEYPSFEQWVIENYPALFAEWEVEASHLLDLDEWLEMEHPGVIMAWDRRGKENRKMEPTLALARGGLKALLLRAAHYALVYQAGPKLPEEEQAARHRQAHEDAVVLEALAGVLHDPAEDSNGTREGVGASQAGLLSLRGGINDRD